LSGGDLILKEEVFWIETSNIIYINSNQDPNKCRLSTALEANLYFKKYYSIVFGLRRFLKDTITLEEARETIKVRMENREENFLRIVEKSVYGYKRSPYLKLLKLAGYDYSDVKNLVLNEGLDSALKTLKDEGIYVSYEESKGKKPIIRLEKTLEIKESDFHNPHISSYYESQTGASRSRGTKIKTNFNFLEQKAVYASVSNNIFDIQDAPWGIWLPALPISSGITRILTNEKVGVDTVKWFTPMDPGENIVHRANGWILNAMLIEGRLLGKKLPKPKFVHLNNSLVIGRWMNSMMKETGRCCQLTNPSGAVRICNEAEKNGLELDGAIFYVGGEPLTRAKQEKIMSLGCDVIPNYVMSECGAIGYGCKNPVNVDEVHFFKDSLALTKGKKFIEQSEVKVDSFFLTNLLYSAPITMINVETDDFGVVESRNCGCGFQKLGFTEHIHGIRSFSKLTGEGVTFHGFNLIKVLEEDLPGLFGGGPIDYQVVEKEDEDGFTQVILNVSPDVGGINEEELKRKFIELLNPSGRNTNVDMLDKGGNIFVERDYPIQTRSGKIMSIHIVH
jgi:hypothetical protein